MSFWILIELKNRLFLLFHSPTSMWDNLKGIRQTMFIGYNHPIKKSVQVILHGQYKIRFAKATLLFNSITPML